MTTLVCQVFAAAGGILFRILLDPVQMGYWQGFKLALNYGNYASLGVSKGATRELSIALGRGDQEAAQHHVNLAFAFNLLTSGGYALLLFGIAIWVAANGQSGSRLVWSAGLAAIGCLSVIQRHVTFQVSVLRARQAFAATSLLNLLEATLTLSVGAAAVWCCGLPGLFVATLVTLVASGVYLARLGPCAVRWAWDGREIRRLAVIGAPMLAVAIVSSLGRTLDRWMILAFSAQREYDLGCYSLALLITNQLAGVAGVFGIVMQPRYGELLGRSGSNRHVARLAARITEFKAVVMSLAGMAAIFWAPWLLVTLLPDYGEGLLPLMIRVPGAVALAVALPAGQYLIAVDRQRAALVVHVVTLGMSALGCFYSLHAGWGLVGVACAMTAGDLLQLAVLGILAFGTALTTPQRRRLAAIVLAALAPQMALAAMQLKGLPGNAEGGATLLSAGGIFFVVAVVVVLLRRLGGWTVFLRKAAPCDGCP